MEQHNRLYFYEPKNEIAKIILERINFESLANQNPTIKWIAKESVVAEYEYQKFLFLLKWNHINNKNNEYYNYIVNYKNYKKEFENLRLTQAKPIVHQDFKIWVYRRSNGGGG